MLPNNLRPPLAGTQPGLGFSCRIMTSVIAPHGPCFQKQSPLRFTKSPKQRENGGVGEVGGVLVSA